MSRKLLIFLLVAVVGAGGLIWWLMQREEAARHLVLYGNIDLRQVQLAFNNSERIAAVLVQEGDHVKQGQLLARLDTSRLEPQVAQAVAQAAAQRQPGLKTAVDRKRLPRHAPMSNPPKPTSSMPGGSMSGLKAPRKCRPVEPCASRTLTPPKRLWIWPKQSWQ